MTREINYIIEGIRNEHEFCDNLEKIIADKIFPIIEDYKNFTNQYSIQK